MDSKPLTIPMRIDFADCSDFTGCTKSAELTHGIDQPMAVFRKRPITLSGLRINAISARRPLTEKTSQ